jgi:uncharacterized membrane-anchored protein
VAKLSDFCKRCRSKDRKLMLLVSSVLFTGISVVAYLFVNTVKEHFGVDVSTGLHIGISVLAGFIMALTSVGFYRNHCKRCNEQRVAPPRA